MSNGESFLIDTNCFISAFKNFYSFDFAPSFWIQMAEALSKSNVYIMDVVKAEILEGDDELAEWFNSLSGISILSKKDLSIINAYAEVLKHIQNSPNYTEAALKAWSKEKVADPWLIATAVAKNLIIVTMEARAGVITTPSSKPKIPNIAADFDVVCVDLFHFMRSMEFRL